MATALKLKEKVDLVKLVLVTMTKWFVCFLIIWKSIWKAIVIGMSPDENCFRYKLTFRIWREREREKTDKFGLNPSILHFNAVSHVPFLCAVYVILIKITLIFFSSWWSFPKPKKTCHWLCTTNEPSLIVSIHFFPNDISWPVQYLDSLEEHSHIRVNGSEMKYPTVLWFYYCYISRWFCNIVLSF